MKLETVSKVKGWVALVSGVIWVLGGLYVNLVRPDRDITWYAGFSGLICMIYTVKWFRLRRRMREWEYRRVVSDRG